MLETTLSQPSSQRAPAKGTPREEAPENNPEGFATVPLRHGKQARQLAGSPQSAHLYESIG